MWSGKPPTLAHIRIFGCASYVHQTKSKLETGATKCVILGYLKGVKGYMLSLLGV